MSWQVLTVEGNWLSLLILISVIVLWLEFIRIRRIREECAGKVHHLINALQKFGKHDMECATRYAFVRVQVQEDDTVTNEVETNECDCGFKEYVMGDDYVE